jgi:CRP/FNR family transcriptional regulator, cyclic AMP receptor protein
MNANIDQTASRPGFPDVRALLDATTLFGGLGDAGIASLVPHTSVHWLRAKETLFVQGEPGDAVFVLVEGSMKLVRRIGAAREHVVRLARAGEVLAETVLFSRCGYPSTAVALEKSCLLAIDAQAFSALLRSNPLLAWKVMERLGKRIEELQAQTELLATHTAEQKVAAYLLRRYRALPASDSVIVSSCRRSDLASLLALAPETLCRVITEFKRRGWIRSDAGRIVVVDPGGLEGAAP